MKHYINQIVIMCLCLLCGTAYGQTGTLYKVPMQGTDNIVRYEPTTGYHVTYSLVAGNENHFSLTDMNTLSDVMVATGLTVTDPRSVINAGTASFDYDIHFPISAKFLVDTLPVHVEIPSICIELLK